MSTKTMFICENSLSAKIATFICYKHAVFFRQRQVNMMDSRSFHCKQHFRQKSLTVYLYFSFRFKIIWMNFLSTKRNFQMGTSLKSVVYLLIECFKWIARKCFEIIFGCINLLRAKKKFKADEGARSVQKKTAQNNQWMFIGLNKTLRVFDTGAV